jgi:carboxylesterase type B
LKNQSGKKSCVKFGTTFSAIVISTVLIVLYVRPTFIEQQINKFMSDKLQHEQVNNSLLETPEEPVDIDEVIVTTQLGKIRGKRLEHLGNDLNVFLGVPYATPPMGSLRFKRTVPIKPWANTINATQLPSACIQPEFTQMLFPIKILNYNISDDCLFLNIWAPVRKEDDEPLAVMVFIHGGMFTIGSIGVEEYDGRTLASYGNVIVVTMQYRLGIFGFMDFGIKSIPGNMALWDQAMAIKWVNRNIEHFGGDPSKITLFGQSAGKNIVLTCENQIDIMD